jgi:hypothetical protein
LNSAQLCPVFPAAHVLLTLQAQKPFDGTMYNMMGSPYAMMEADAMTFGKPYRVRPAAVTGWQFLRMGLTA